MRDGGDGMTTVSRDVRMRGQAALLKAGNMARRPKPTTKKKAEGNPGKRPLPKNEPQYSGTPERPAGISKAARTEWVRILALLGPVGLATQAEQALLHMYIDAYQRWIEATRRVRLDGMVIETAGGTPVQSPYLQIVNKSKDHLLKYLVELGLTPAAKTKVEQGVPLVPEEENVFRLVKGMKSGAAGGTPPTPTPRLSTRTMSCPGDVTL